MDLMRAGSGAAGVATRAGAKNHFLGFGSLLSFVDRRLFLEKQREAALRRFDFVPRMATDDVSPTAAIDVTSADLESTSSTHANLLKKAMELKEKGNAFFRAKEYKKAIIRYSKIRA